LVSGAEYYQLAICFSEKATAKIGQAVEQDALLPYVCHADREQRIAVIHLRNCSEASLCCSVVRSSTQLIASIKQRARRADLTAAKIEVLYSLLQTSQPVDEALQKLLIIKSESAADKQK
jgi:hypothetical protein